MAKRRMLCWTVTLLFASLSACTGGTTGTAGSGRPAGPEADTLAAAVVLGGADLPEWQSISADELAGVPAGFSKDLRQQIARCAGGQPEQWGYASTTHLRMMAQQQIEFIGSTAYVAASTDLAEAAYRVLQGPKFEDCRERIEGEATRQVSGRATLDRFTIERTDPPSLRHPAYSDRSTLEFTANDQPLTGIEERVMMVIGRCVVEVTFNGLATPPPAGELRTRVVSVLLDRAEERRDPLAC